MGDKYSPERAKEDELDDMFGENPGYPSGKRPSDLGSLKHTQPMPPPGPPREPTPPRRPED